MDSIVLQCFDTQLAFEYIKSLSVVRLNRIGISSSGQGLYDVIDVVQQFCETTLPNTKTMLLLS